MKPFAYFEPATLNEALDLLDQYGEKARILAGGTDLVVQMKQRIVAPEAVINLRRIEELNFIEVDSEIRLGPLARLSQLASHPSFAGRMAILREAALAVGDAQIRNVATIGGNIANASPSADISPALLALGAKVKLARKGAVRVVNLDEFWAGPFSTHLKRGELIVGIFVSPLPEGGGAYVWTPKRTAVDETLVGVGAWLLIDSPKEICLRASLALSSVAPVPFRCRQAESFIQGKILSPETLCQAGEMAATEASPRSRADYRRTLISILVEEALIKAWNRALIY